MAKNYAAILLFYHTQGYAPPSSGVSIDNSRKGGLLLPVVISGRYWREWFGGRWAAAAICPHWLVEILMKFGFVLPNSQSEIGELLSLVARTNRSVLRSPWPHRPTFASLECCDLHRVAR
jgi:hypothetical protein